MLPRSRVVQPGPWSKCFPLRICVSRIDANRKRLRLMPTRRRAAFISWSEYVVALWEDYLDTGMHGGALVCDAGSPVGLPGWSDTRAYKRGPYCELRCVGLC